MDKLIELLASFKNQQTLLCGIESKLPEPFRTQCAAIRQKFDTILAEMPETEKVEAATAANSAMRYMVFTIGEMLSVQKAVSDMLTGMHAEHGRLTASVPVEVEAAIQKRIDSGDIVLKSAAQELVQAAVVAERQRQQVFAGRQRDLTLCQMPLPEDTAVIEAEDFDARKTAATERVAAIKARGLDPAKFSNLVWCSKPVFDQQMALVDAAIATKGSERVSAGNPVLGGGNAPAAGQRVVG